VNVADQRRDPNSLLNWTERIIRTRKECTEIGWGDWTMVPRLPDSVLGIRYDWSGRATIVLHNFRDQRVPVRLRVDGANGKRLVNLLSQDRSEADDNGHHTIELEPYGYRWLRVGDSERPIPDEKTRRT
jgi:maltose alpha-D-glucosyltransferase/alpha-amylase